MSRSDEVRKLAKWIDRPVWGEEIQQSAAALRDYADLLEAAEELMRLRDEARGEGWILQGAAWERLRKAVQG